MVPVINKDGSALMPCKERRARVRMEKGEAIPYYQKGIFCIKLTKQVSNPKYQAVIIGVDPGSRREGYTVATKNSVVVNITSDTPNWVKASIESRRNLRRSRRNRKTPYRKCRYNRARLSEKVPPPSTKARWDAKLRVIKVLTKILPITIINVEDIAARSKKGARKWNASFSPLQVGKKYFFAKLAELYPSIDIQKTKGYETWLHRKIMRYSKTKQKLSYSWDAHNVDSHSLCELGLKTCVKPFRKVFALYFLSWSRRQTHVQLFAKGNVRKPYGSSLSIGGLPKGAVIRNNKTRQMVSCGSSVATDKLSIHSMRDNKRIKQDKKVNMNDWQVLYYAKWLINPIH